LSFLKKYGFADDYLKVKVEKQAKEIWNELVVNGLSQYTTSVVFKEGTFFVYTNSPVVKMELQMRKNEIKEKLNQKLGQNIIKKVEIR